MERVTDNKLRKKFLEKGAGLSLASALETAGRYEATESSAKEMQHSGEKVLLVKRERAARSKPASVSGQGACGFSGQGASRKECGNCGSWKHSTGASMCSAKKAKCRKCGKIGHFERKCRSSSATPSPKPAQSTHHVDSFPQTPESCVDGDLDTSICGVRAGNNPQVKVDVRIDNKQVAMELDTGAAVSLIGEDLYLDKLADWPLQPTNQVLKSYTGDRINAVGQIRVPVAYGNQHIELPIMVVHQATAAPPLLGRNWLAVLKLDCPSFSQRPQQPDKLSASPRSPTPSTGRASIQTSLQMASAR